MRNHRKVLGDRFNEGARLLWLAIQAKSLSHASAAKVLGWSRATISRVIYGDVVPGIGLLADVKREFKVPLDAWALAPTREFVPPALVEEEAEEGAA
jgi:transcriptional regulator with XRE-family HTH domain